MSSSDATVIFDRLFAAFTIEENVLRVIVDELVQQTMNMKLNKLTIQPIFKKIRKSCPKSNLPEMNILFKCCYVLILSLREHFLLLDNVEDLCGDYPEFVGLPADELNKLLKFRNAMKISLLLIDAKHHKGELLEICGRLSGKLVTTGGSQTTETKRRVLIYEREGGVEAEGKSKKRKHDCEVKIKEEGELKKVKMEPVSPGEARIVKSEYSQHLPHQVVVFLTQQLRNKFSSTDADAYQLIIEKTLVQTTLGKELNKLTLRAIMKEVRKLFPRKEIWAEMNILYKCCYVLILSNRDPDGLLWLQHDQLLNAYPYPEFDNLTSHEVEKLLVFRNAMCLSLQLIEAKHHKGELLEIAGRLSGRVVTTGGGQTADTTRCVMIYEQEGGISGTAKKAKPALTAAASVQVPLPATQTQQSFLLPMLPDLAGSGLERADTGFSLFDKTFSFQSNGSLGRFESIGNLSVSDFPLDSTALAEEFPAAATENRNAALRATPSPKPVAPVRVPVQATGSPKEQETDIDTELDSIEVATEVDEHESPSGDEELAQMPDHMEEAETMVMEGKEMVSDDECADALYELWRTQSVPLRGNTLRTETVVRTRTRTSSTITTTSTDMERAELARTDTFGRVDVGIARLGSLRSVNMESFSWSQ